ncbi:hypothetical protein GQX74_007801 [Glossina fuscipes]|nr:hypothetical protein GQX74_007801 [Glossina fuscipes]
MKKGVPKTSLAFSIISDTHGSVSSSGLSASSIIYSISLITSSTLFMGSSGSLFKPFNIKACISKSLAMASSSLFISSPGVPGASSFLTGFSPKFKVDIFSETNLRPGFNGKVHIKYDDDLASIRYTFPQQPQTSTFYLKHRNPH